ncbi:unnamed protein product [Prorocentrum cordatum]|uniref:Uncharacterized protein n=1 Tax=Prorocentrum cordatum TaxID=2364126 RepID=A0ABN9WYV4_9DINO|nr:unnamed protein product [Polarella glacialis]
MPSLARPAFLLSSLHKVRDDQSVSPDYRTDTDRIFALSAARNEYESFQLVVPRPKAAEDLFDTVDGVQIAASEAGASFKFLVHGVRSINISQVSDCDGRVGRWPDALVPAVDPWFNETRRVFPAPFSGNQSALTFWVDLFVGPDTPAGSHAFHVHLRVSSSGFSRTRGLESSPADIELPFVVRVFDFSLDSEPAYKSSYGLSSIGMLVARFGEQWEKYWPSAGRESTTHGEPDSGSTLAAMQQQYLELGLMHRVSFTHGVRDPAILKALESGDAVDWAPYDRRWRDLLGSSGRKLPFGLTNARLTSVESPGPGSRVGAGKDAAAAVLPTESQPDPSSADNITVEFYRHFLLDRGWPADRILSKVCDEPSSAQQWQECAETCRALKAAFADSADAGKLASSLRCEVTTHISQLEDERGTNYYTNGSFILRSEEVGVFTALVNFMESSRATCADYPRWCLDRNTRPDFEKWMAADPQRELWLYQSCMSDGCSSGIGKSDGCIPDNTCRRGWPSMMIDNPHVTMHRAMPLVTRHYNASGELYWSVNFGDSCAADNPAGNCRYEGRRYSLDTWSDQLLQGGNGDGQLTYPGTFEKIGGSPETFIPVASIRLKALRDGIEDWMWLQKLSELSGASSRQFLSRLVQSGWRYELNPDEWLKVRDEIGMEIEFRLRGRDTEVFN